MNKNYDRLIGQCDRQLERLGINKKVVDVEEREVEKENMADFDSTNHSMGSTTCEEEVMEQRVEADDSCSGQDEKQTVVWVDWADNNNIDLLLTRAGTAGVVENDARDGKSEVVATEEEVRAGADDHCTEQDDDKVIVRADESEAQDGRINTDAGAGNSAVESTGRTTSRGGAENTDTGRVLVTENGVVRGQGGALVSREQSDDSLAPKYEDNRGWLVVVTSAEQRPRDEGGTRCGIG